MSNLSLGFRMIGVSLGAALAASLLVFLLGVLVLGAQLAEWSEAEGRLFGVVGTLAGLAGAVIGLVLVAHAEERSSK